MREKKEEESAAALQSLAQPELRLTDIVLHTEIPGTHFRRRQKRHDSFLTLAVSSALYRNLNPPV